MSKKDKLARRFLSEPTDFTWDDLSLGWVMKNFRREKPVVLELDLYTKHVNRSYFTNHIQNQL